jgi:hypothetical protein
MRVRNLIAEKKVQKSDSGWRSDDMPPRACPLFPKGRPSRAGWQWRSAKATSLHREYILVSLVNPGRSDWKATLIVATSTGHSVVARFEHHSSQPGRHVHSDCTRSGLEDGATGMDGLDPIPPHKPNSKNAIGYTAPTFWAAARAFFRIKDDLGPLFGGHA